MDLGLFLPKTYNFVRQDYVINGEHFNQFITTYNTNDPRYTVEFIIGFVLFVLGIVLLMVSVALDSGNDSWTNKIKLGVSPLLAAVLGIVMFFGGLCLLILGPLGASKVSEKVSTTDFGNGFQVKQSSFIIQPNEKSFQSNVADYILDGKKDSISTSSKNYAVYAKVYDSSSHNYYNYLIGNMVNGTFETITTRQKKIYQSDTEKHDRLIKIGQLKTLDTYIEFIKKYHLEDNFKDNAKLIINNKFYDKNYKPQLIMKGKDGRILYMKHNIDKKDIANVGITR